MAFHICLSLFVLSLAPGAAIAQTNLIAGHWRVLDHEAVTLDHESILLQRGAQGNLLELGKGPFRFSEVGFAAQSVDFLYTAGRNGDSTATSSQSFLPLAATYHQLSPSCDIVRFEVDGCPEYRYELQGDLLELHRYYPQTNQLRFESAQAQIQDASYVQAVVADIERHFQCKGFERLHVTIRTAKSEYASKDAARLRQLQLDRVATVKALFAAHGVVEIDQLQIETNLAYMAAEPTVSFEFRKVDAWLQNDSIAFKILPATGTNYAHVDRNDVQASHITQVALTDAQRKVVRDWTKEQWIDHLEGSNTDFATSLILYAVTKKDVPAWYGIGQMEWKLFAKETDLAIWLPYLEIQLPQL